MLLMLINDRKALHIFYFNSFFPNWLCSTLPSPSLGTGETACRKVFSRFRRNYGKKQTNFHRSDFFETVLKTKSFRKSWTFGFQTVDVSMLLVSKAFKETCRWKRLKKCAPDLIFLEESLGAARKLLKEKVTEKYCHLFGLTIHQEKRRINKNET